jgi:Zn-dependent peptidase ImmA (M78 family)
VRRAELAAESLRRAVEGSDISLAAVDVKAAAEYFGVTVLGWQANGNGARAALIRNARALFVNVALGENRARFAVAHALGHLALGHGGDFYCPEAERSAREADANRFAAALLMPAPLVRALWLKLDGGPPSAKVRAIAERLRVSREALGYRLTELGLTRESPARRRGR